MKITYGKCVLALVIDHVGVTWAGLSRPQLKLVESLVG